VDFLAVKCSAWLLMSKEVLLEAFCWNKSPKYGSNVESFERRLAGYLARASTLCVCVCVCECVCVCVCVCMCASVSENVLCIMPLVYRM